MLTRLTALTAQNRVATSVAAFVAALLFVFLQTSDQYNTIADDILIFATVALGLNIVVGLAGLLDLGYVAFLGVGAYSAALRLRRGVSSRFAHIGAAVLGPDPDRRGRLDHRGRHHRRPDAATARRLPRDRHARLR